VSIQRNGAANTLSIRVATRDDLPQVAHIYLAAFPDTVEQLGLQGIEPLAIEDILRIPLDAEPGSFLVAESGSRVVGYAICPARVDRLWRVGFSRGHLFRIAARWLTGRYGIGLRPAWLAFADKLHFLRGEHLPRARCDGRVLSIAVDPRLGRRGIGRRLLEEGLQYLRAKGAARVRLEVRPGNEPARRLYEGVGFRTVGAVHDTRGRWDVMILHWSNNANAPA
jgi:ribosomal-protein-alanine N-acetyltransferase